MPRLSKLLALVLVTLWFPVTQHCGLEAAGLIERQCATDCATGQVGSDDGCCAVEKTPSKIGTDSARVSAPELVPGVCLLDIALFSLTTVVEMRDFAVTGFEFPQNWVSTWHFARRAAPPSRAPTASIA